MSLVFMGFQTWGLVSLESLVDAGHSVALVVTHPASFERDTASFADSVEDYAAARGIPVMTATSSGGDELLARVRKAGADLIVSSNWRRLIPPRVLAATRLGGVNVHRSLLPKYGGFSPLNWAVARGEAETGVTVHRLDPGLDEGPILGQGRVPIGPDDTATDVFHRSNGVIASLLPRVVAEVLDGSAAPAPQDQAGATFFHRRTLRDNQIDWKSPARATYDLIRAQSDPFANAYTFHEGRRLFVKSARLGDPRYRGNPGRLVARDGTGVVVICGGGEREPTCSIRIGEVRPEGGEALPAGDYFRSLDHRLGDRMATAETTT